MECPSCGLEEVFGICPRCSVVTESPMHSTLEVSGLCKDCRKWEVGDGWYCPKTHGYCNRFKAEGWRSELPMDEILKPGDGPAGHGDGGEPGRVKTGPLFGCIKFEAKP